MANRCHEIDPDGDVELILRNPDAPFAEWDENFLVEYVPSLLEIPEPVATQDFRESTRKPKKKKGKNSKPIIRLFRSLDPGNESVTCPEVPEPVPEPAPEQPEPEPEPPAHEPEPVGDDVKTRSSSQSRDAAHSAEDVEVHMQLSSKHLMLASVVFKKMLQGPWEESRTHTMEASDWDAEALLILMNIIHGRNRAVPRSISLEMLAKIAVLVDYYQCHEAVELFAACWTQNLSPLPKEYCRDLTLWISISWVFYRKDLFETLTKVAIKETAGPLQTLGLPIPQHIVEVIDQQRQETINDIISGLHTLVSYFHIRSKCTFECSSILLGALTKQMQIKGLLEPKPKRPFLGHSVAGTTAIVCDFKTPNWTVPGSYYSHGCKLESFMDTTIKSFTDGVNGLQLDEFCRDYVSMTGR
ncbi:hypothetical protein PG999_005519 [Apiospora kogelbergensis]|uniref:BTB domain-containing protein n=1 Tax=Apiospora kogelbergensis TaxID=1337665 RepID=A0AAW0R2E8_9PEZI